MSKGLYSPAQEARILANLVKAMREGKVDKLVFKRKSRTSKQFDCEVHNRDAVCNMTASSTEGVHDLGYLFLNTLARSACSGEPQPVPENHEAKIVMADVANPMCACGQVFGDEWTLRDAVEHQLREGHLGHLLVMPRKKEA